MFIEHRCLLIHSAPLGAQYYLSLHISLLKELVDLFLALVL